MGPWRGRAPDRQREGGGVKKQPKKAREQSHLVGSRPRLSTFASVWNNGLQPRTQACLHASSLFWGACVYALMLSNLGGGALSWGSSAVLLSASIYPHSLDNCFPTWPVKLHTIFQPLCVIQRAPIWFFPPFYYHLIGVRVTTDAGRQC